MIFDFNELEFRTANLAKTTEVLHRLEVQLEELCKISGQPRNSKFERMIMDIYVDVNIDDQWNAFVNQFNSSHNNFLSRFSEKHSTLSKSTLLLCATIRMKKNVKEIASLLNTSVSDIEDRISKLHDSLIPESDQSLVSYIHRF